MMIYDRFFLGNSIFVPVAAGGQYNFLDPLVHMISWKISKLIRTSDSSPQNFQGDPVLVR